jgi:hypothetical protein
MMKRFTLSKVAGAGLVALSLAVLPVALPASAQTNNNPANEAVQETREDNAPNLDTTPLQETRGQKDNWGWLGLVGLAGLLNLLRKPERPTAYREPDVVTRSGDRY